MRTSANSIGPVLAAMFIAVARKRGVEPTSFRVMLQNDALKEYLARGTYIFPPRHGLKFSVDVIEYCATNLPTGSRSSSAAIASGIRLHSGRGACDCGRERDRLCGRGGSTRRGSFVSLEAHVLPVRRR